MRARSLPLITRVVERERVHDGRARALGPHVEAHARHRLEARRRARDRARPAAPRARPPRGSRAGRGSRPGSGRTRCRSRAPPRAACRRRRAPRSARPRRRAPRGSGRACRGSAPPRGRRSTATPRSARRSAKARAASPAFVEAGFTQRPTAAIFRCAMSSLAPLAARADEGIATPIAFSVARLRSLRSLRARTRGRVRCASRACGGSRPVLEPRL